MTAFAKDASVSLHYMYMAVFKNINRHNICRFGNDQYFSASNSFLYCGGKLSEHLI